MRLRMPDRPNVKIEGSRRFTTMELRNDRRDDMQFRPSCPSVSSRNYGQTLIGDQTSTEWDLLAIENSLVGATLHCRAHYLRIPSIRSARAEPR
jgi:hypothetical protein